MTTQRATLKDNHQLIVEDMKLWTAVFNKEAGAKVTDDMIKRFNNVMQYNRVVAGEIQSKINPTLIDGFAASARKFLDAAYAFFAKGKTVPATPRTLREFIFPGEGGKRLSLSQQRELKRSDTEHKLQPVDAQQHPALLRPQSEPVLGQHAQHAQEVKQQVVSKGAVFGSPLSPVSVTSDDSIPSSPSTGASEHPRLSISSVSSVQSAGSPESPILMQSPTKPDAQSRQLRGRFFARMGISPTGQKIVVTPRTHVSLQAGSGKKPVVVSLSDESLKDLMHQTETNAQGQRLRNRFLASMGISPKKAGTTASSAAVTVATTPRKA
jgi:hypothetical protein